MEKIRNVNEQKLKADKKLLLFILIVCLFYVIAVNQVAFMEKVLTSNVHLNNCCQHNFNPFPEKIVHFDLKGAPPKIEYYAKIFPLLRKLNVQAVLMEYEDMFPYKGFLKIITKQNSYTEKEIAMIQVIAENNQLEIIPLVQTMGHLEFVLKHSKFSHLREKGETASTICPSADESWNVITEMLGQVRSLHPKSKRIHIGADEAWQVGTDERCIERFLKDSNFTMDDLKLSHISRTARYSRDVLKFENVFAWNDMFERSSTYSLKKYEFGKLLIPVVWGYAVDVTKPEYFPTGMLQRYSEVFDKLLFASAYKGANGQANVFVDINRYFLNQISYVNLYYLNSTELLGRVGGIVLTGWQRYNHFAPLCELHPSSIPSMVIDLLYLNNTSLNLLQLVHIARGILGCSIASEQLPIHLESGSYYPTLEALFMHCNFAGHEIYELVENLRFLHWKSKRISSQFDVLQIGAEIVDIEVKLRQALKKYFCDDTVNEFINANVISLNASLNDFSEKLNEYMTA